MALTKEKLQVHSDSFAEGQRIPDHHSAYLDNVSPPLSWSALPPETQSIAILCEDPDAPREPAFVHWMVVDLPPNVSRLPEGIPNDASPLILEGGTQGTNDKGTLGYFGPRPPEGDPPHHYHFHILALDTRLGLRPGFPADDFNAAIRDHVIGQGWLVGTYVAPPL